MLKVDEVRVNAWIKDCAETPTVGIYNNRNFVETDDLLPLG